MRKTACPVVWEGGGAQSPSLDPIQGTRPTDSMRGVMASCHRLAIGWDQEQADYQSAAGCHPAPRDQDPCATRL